MAKFRCWPLLRLLLRLVLSAWIIDHNDAFHIHTAKTKDVAAAASTTRLSSSSSSQHQDPLRVIVVGGGVGGLAISSRISSRIASSRLGGGENRNQAVMVTLFEKNEHVGGRCGSFHVNVDGYGRFRHERGASLLLLPHVYRDLFEDVAGTQDDDGSRKQDDDACIAVAAEYGLVMKPCVPAYKVIFEDGDWIDLGFPRQQPSTTTTGRVATTLSDLEKESRQTMDRYETDGAIKWDAYLRACEAFLDCGLPNFIEERLNLDSFPNFLREALRDFGKAWPLKPHSDVLDSLFASNKMKALASFQDLYVGLEPYRNNELFGGGVLQSTAPAVFGLLAAIELHPTNDKCGVYAPMGGFEAVAASMTKLATDQGVDIRCGTYVTSVTQDGVYYRTSNGGETQFEKADLVIMNADLPYATKSLVDHPTNQDERYDWDDSFRFSSGVIAFHWSLSRALTDLNTHNVFLSAESRPAAESSWQVVRGTDTTTTSFASDGEPFNFYVHRASATDPTAAPEEMDSIMVLVPCKTLQRNKDLARLPRDEALRRYQEQFDAAFIDRVRDAVLHRFAAMKSLPDIRSAIIDEVADTPATYADQYNVGAGTPFALSHGFKQLSLARPGPASSHLSNVLFCGASTRPGNGVPLVLLGAKLVAEQAIVKLGTLAADDSRLA